MKPKRHHAPPPLPHGMDPVLRQLLEQNRTIGTRDFGSVPLELGDVCRGVGSEPWSDAEILEHVARHQRGDFGEYGRFEAVQINDRHRKGDVASLSPGQMNRKRIEMRQPHAVTSKYVTDKGTLYISTEDTRDGGRVTVAYGAEGR